MAEGRPGPDNLWDPVILLLSPHTYSRTVTNVNVSIKTKSLFWRTELLRTINIIGPGSNLIFHVKHELRLCFRAWNVYWQLVAVVALWSLA